MKRPTRRPRPCTVPQRKNSVNNSVKRPRRHRERERERRRETTSVSTAVPTRNRATTKTPPKKNKTKDARHFGHVARVSQRWRHQKIKHTHTKLGENMASCYWPRLSVADAGAPWRTATPTAPFIFFLYFFDFVSPTTALAIVGRQVNQWPKMFFFLCKIGSPISSKREQKLGRACVCVCGKKPGKTR